jgi:hypothetical protein
VTPAITGIRRTTDGSNSFSHAINIEEMQRRNICRKSRNIDNIFYLGLFLGRQKFGPELVSEKKAIDSYV